MAGIRAPRTEYASVDRTYYVCTRSLSVMFPRESSETIGPIQPDAADAAWALCEAARRVLPSRTSGNSVPGLLGTTFQTTTVPVIYADYLTLYLPGLRDCGIEAEITLLPDRIEELVPAPGLPIPVCGFHGEPFTDAPDEDDGEGAAWNRGALGLSAKTEHSHAGTLSEVDGEGGDRPAAIDRRRTLARCGLLHQARNGCFEWSDRAGGMHTETEETFRAHFSRAVRFTGHLRPLARRSAVIGSVRRATVFALSCPDRYLTGSDADAAVRGAAAVFLTEAAGTGRDPLSLRWRQAAQRLAEADVPAALDRLSDATLRSFHLPPAVHGALSGTADPRITDVQLHDLIYLARAGNRDLKVLAAARLAIRRNSRAVRQTLEQLSVSGDPLVRAAATTALTADA